MANIDYTLRLENLMIQSFLNICNLSIFAKIISILTYLFMVYKESLFSTEASAIGDKE